MVLHKRMGRIKSTGTQTTKGKRVRTYSNSLKPPIRNRLSKKEKQQRYEEFRNWTFIMERKVQLQPEQYDIILNGL